MLWSGPGLEGENRLARRANGLWLQDDQRLVHRWPLQTQPTEHLVLHGELTMDTGPLARRVGIRTREALAILVASFEPGTPMAHVDEPGQGVSAGTSLPQDFSQPASQVSGRSPSSHPFGPAQSPIARLTRRARKRLLSTPSLPRRPVIVCQLSSA